jgi:hypothetical protein
MSIDEFIFEKLQHLENFEAYWKEHAKKHPKQFPDECNPGDWDDQLQVWIDTVWNA